MTTSLTIVSIHEETSDTKSFILKPTHGSLNYLPGQFITVLHPRAPGVRRSYSLSSHPVIDPFPKITVKRIANGQFSRWLFDDVKVGDTLETIGASGFFTLPGSLSDDDTLIFLAAGSGITPAYSLLKEVLFQRKQKAVLVYSNRSERSTIFYGELQALAKKFAGRLTPHFLFSDHHDLSRARLNPPLLIELINRIPDKARSLVYLCGPPIYMQTATITLLTENILPANIRTEKFNTDKPIVKERPPDTDEHQVTIRYQGKLFSLAVQFPNTVLKTAQLQGVDLPYSCEAGRCGTCAATCLSGKIWMSRNEVLLDKEMTSGRVLTCTGYPVGGDVQLTIDG